MRVFILSAMVAIVLAVAAAYGLSAFQESIATANISNSVRLDQQERVNIYGREPT
jgi:hypothetical protein